MPTLVPNLDSPLIVTPTPTPSGFTTKWGGAPSWNRETKEFDITPGGQIVMLNDVGAFIQWVWKALITARWKYKIYTRYGNSVFGNDFPPMIGKPYHDTITESLAIRFCKEAIKDDSRIASIPFISSSLKGDSLFISISIIMVTGRELQLQQMWTVK